MDILHNVFSTLWEGIKARKYRLAIATGVLLSGLLVTQWPQDDRVKIVADFIRTVSVLFGAAI